MKHTFLHISDLHYRPNWPEETQLVCDKFFKDLSSQIPSNENCYLIFSGDLVFSGGSTDIYSEFENNFKKPLVQAGFSSEKIICIPGNHDISQDALKPLLIMQNGALSQINDEELFNNNLPQLSQTLFAPKFSNYVKYEPQFAKYTCCQGSMGGTGWDLGNGIGVYCLNTALCSSGALKDLAGKPISDEKQLMIDTRSLYQWLSTFKFTTRILVMHHPLDWLAEWSKTELQKIINESFQVVFSGHIHQNSAELHSQGSRGSVFVAAPALFTKKTDALGYSFVTIDSNTPNIEIVYRQWTPAHKFVAGTSLAGNDLGKKTFSTNIHSINNLEVQIPATETFDTLAILQAEFNEAATSYSSKKKLWIDRDLASIPETDSERANLVTISQNELIRNLRSCIIRAPKQYGLTCLGRYMALEYYRQSKIGSTILMLDATTMPRHKQGIIQHIESRCKELKTSQKTVSAFILDNWQSEKGMRRILRELKTEYPEIPITLLQSVDDCDQIANAIESEDEQPFETLYLWALTRSRIRELVVSYVQGLDHLDDGLVTKKLIEDIDALNIHRTPLNCLLLLKLTEQAFDDSPVNRTEIIGRVLYLLFFQFNKIPRYATRPDLKDCEYALGYFCEWLIRLGKTAFSKNEFYKKVDEYCTLQILDLDIEVLFAFLATENIFVKKGSEFEFRFNYWLYYFAAHRMHHDPNFAEFILSECRYSAYPEIIEFYAGIDRRRTDAVVKLTEDLAKMNADFLKRTGISSDFNPFKDAQWSPSDDEIEQLHKQVTESMTESALPTIVKDSIADQSYDRSKPYSQELAKFINDSSLGQMVQTMKGAARALRNSDHVSPNAKTKLLEEVIRCWIRVCQILVIISPVLADKKSAVFEGIGFYLSKQFDDDDTVEKRWQSIMTSVVGNIVNWYQDDIFSKKMGALLAKYAGNNEGELGQLLVLMVMVKQKPPGWENEIERFIVKENKNSFYLNKIFTALRADFKIGFSNERTRQELRRLAAMAMAKHATGAKHPNNKLVEKAKAALDETEKIEKPKI